MIERKLAVLDVKPGSASESQSGIQLQWPRIFGAYEEPDRRSGIAVVAMHPSTNFMNHPLMRPLSQRGICFLGLNSRYINNDSVLLMERVIQDLGAGVAFLRKQGYRKVYLLGWSGGAALSAFYQSQATKLTALKTPAGDNTGLCPEDLPRADGIILCAAHPGRQHLFLDWLDPSVTDERDPIRIDASLDMYALGRKIPFDQEFLAKYRTAQIARRDRIEAWVVNRLAMLRSIARGPTDEAFVIHRTHADPRFLDMTLDANGRTAAGLWGDPRASNLAANAIGRYTSLTAFLSQWSTRSQADGLANIACTDVPILFLDFTADAAAYPSTRERWLSHTGSRAELISVEGADHYLRAPGVLDFTADQIVRWMGRLTENDSG